jgi:hypothetical protein
VDPSHSASGLNRINRAKTIQTNLNLSKPCPKFILSKQGLPGIENFEIKYGCEGFEYGNNFLRRNFFRFEVECQLKIWEVKVSF